MLDSARTARRTHPVRDRWRNWLAAWAVFLAGLSLTFAAWRFLAGSELERDRNVFHHRVRELAGRLTKRIEADAQILRGAAGLFQSVREVTRDEWRRYVDSLQLAEAYPGIQGVGFSEWIAPEGLAAHELRIRAQGFPSYAVKPPGVRERYTSIVYLEPFTALNQRAFGFDMYSEPVRRAAMDRAIDTQSITVSDAIVLLQENPGTTQAGIIMYQPIYHWDQPTGTVAERRAAIVGFVYLPIRMGNLTRGALGTLPTDLSFDLYSAPGPASSALLFSTLGQDEPVATDTFAEPLEVFGSRWMLAARELSSDAHDPDQAGGEATALFGVLLSAALAALTVAVTRRREQTRALAASRRASEARFRSYFDLPLVGAALTSPTKGWLAVNERLCELLGYRRAELTDKTWAQLTHLDDLAADVALFERVQAGLQDSYTLEKRLLRKDGSSVWTHVAVQAVRDAEGQIEYFAALIEDRGRQKRQEQILEARVNLMDHAQTHGLHDILVRTLDLVEDLTDSCVGFYHFVQPDGRTLTLQAWSTRTARDYCRAEGHGRHYDVDEAGVWVDCIRQGHAVIHNDYEALPHKRGLPPGHAPLVRELAVPVHRAGRIVAVLGVGNKSMGYTEDDVATVTAFADLAWDIAERGARTRADSGERGAFHDHFRTRPRDDGPEPPGGWRLHGRERVFCHGVGLHA